MKKHIQLISASLSLTAFSALSLCAPESQAAKYSLWIHGRNSPQSTQVGNYGDFSYWGPSNTAAGINKKAVNWAGTQSISSTNGKIRDALDCYCTGSNWCYIAVHSAGNLQIGFALDKYATSVRNKKNATPNASGVCGDIGGTQTGWNIYWVDVASGAGGGSELANIGEWVSGEALTTDLKTANARALYNHNQTQGKMLYMFAGAQGTLYSGTLPGQDDEVVAYHSTGGVASAGAFCNPGDWFCDGTLNLGTQATSNGKAKWSNHFLDFRDDGEQYNHYANGQWGGIVGVVRQDMVSYAL